MMTRADCSLIFDCLYISINMMTSHLYVYSDNLPAYRTSRDSFLGATFNKRLQIKTLKKNCKFSSLSLTNLTTYHRL